MHFFRTLSILVLVALFPNVSYANDWPALIVEDGRIKSDFAHGQYPSKPGRTHAGIDIEAYCGANIYAAADGTVVKSVTSRLDRDFSSVGYAIVLQHRETDANAKPTYSAYFHMQEPAPSRLLAVSEGQVIGSVGDTGSASQCYLHFEFRHFEGVRGLYHPDWKNIFGIGNRSENEVFLRDWSNPETYMNPGFQQAPAPISRPEDLVTTLPESSELKAAVEELSLFDEAPIGFSSFTQLSTVQRFAIIESVAIHWNMIQIVGLDNSNPIIVTVAFEVDENGVINSIVTPVEPSNPTGEYKIAFEAARRAILKTRNIPLPEGAFPRGLRIEMRFDPNRSSDQYGLNVGGAVSRLTYSSDSDQISSDLDSAIAGFETQSRLASTYDIFDVIKSVRLWSSLHKLAVNAEAIGSIDESITFLNSVNFLGSKLKSTQLAKMRTELAQKSTIGIMSILAHFYIDELYELKEAGGEAFPIPRVVAHSLTDTAINFATANISGQLLDQSLLIAETYFDLSNESNDLVEVIIKGAEINLALLNDPTPKNIDIVRAFIGSTETISRNTAAGLTYAPLIEAASKADIVVYMLKLRASQITGEPFGIDISTARTIVEIYDLEPKTLLGKFMNTITLNNLARILKTVDVESTKYRDFADELAVRFDIVGWEIRAPQIVNVVKVIDQNTDADMSYDCERNGDNAGPLQCPYRERDVCTGVLCLVEGIRKATAELPVFPTPQALEPAFVVYEGEFFRATTTDVFSVPCRSTYTDFSTSKTGTAFRLGSTDAGKFRYWINGEVTSINGADRSMRPQASCVDRHDDWVEITTEFGGTGWVLNNGTLQGSSTSDGDLGDIPDWLKSTIPLDHEFGPKNIYKGSDYTDCSFSDTANCLQRLGGSDDAVSFYRQLDTHEGLGGIMNDFVELGQVDLAEVSYLFQANPFNTFVFANGTPPIASPTSDVFRAMLRASANPDEPILKYLQFSTPNATLSWKYQFLSHRDLGGGKQRFVFLFPVVDGCTACEIVGSALFYYDFVDGVSVDAKLIGYFTDWSNPTGQFRGDNPSVLMQETHVLQYKLNASGYLAGTMDGQFGPKSQAALREFQLENCLSATGELDWATANALAEFEKVPANCENDVVGVQTSNSDYTLFGEYGWHDQSAELSCETSPLTIDAEKIVIYESFCTFSKPLGSTDVVFSDTMTCEGEGSTWQSDKTLSLVGPDLWIKNSEHNGFLYPRCDTQNEPVKTNVTDYQPIIANLADYLETNLASALSSLETGRLIRFEAKNITYQNGKIIMQNSVSPTSSVEAVEDLQQSFSWGGWLNVTQGNNPTARRLTVLCVFDPNTVANVEDGELLIVTAKLTSYDNGSYSGASLVLECAF